jgi:hypothetical protein
MCAKKERRKIKVAWSAGQVPLDGTVWAPSWNAQRPTMFGSCCLSHSRRLPPRYGSARGSNDQDAPNDNRAVF